MQTAITESGEVSIPAQLRRDMHLTPGRIVVWEKFSAGEIRLLVRPMEQPKADPVAAIGFAKRQGLPACTTADWMAILRGGEDD